MDFLYYNLRVAVLIAVFYMFYRLLLSRDSFHQLNRLVLLGTALASFVLPLCVITIHHTEVLSSLPTVETAVVGGGGVSVAPSTPWWQIALPIVYWSGVFLHYYIQFSRYRRYAYLLADARSTGRPTALSLPWPMGKCPHSPGCTLSWCRVATTPIPTVPSSCTSVSASAGIILGMCCSLMFSRRFSGSILLYGCCVQICAPSTSMRLMRRFSQVA